MCYEALDGPTAGNRVVREPTNPESIESLCQNALLRAFPFPRRQRTAASPHPRPRRTTRRAPPRQTAIVLDGAGGETLPGDTPLALAVQRQPWPAALPEQVAAVARVLAGSPLPLSEADLAARFTGKGPWKKRLPQIIDTLEALGRVRRQGALVAGR
jgi:hypothetical protein